MLERPGGARPLALEIKASAAPSPTRGFWSALEDLRAEGFVVCQTREPFPLGGNVEAVPVSALPAILS